MEKELLLQLNKFLCRRHGIIDLNTSYTWEIDDSIIFVYMDKFIIDLKEDYGFQEYELYVSEPSKEALNILSDLIKKSTLYDEKFVQTIIDKIDETL